MSTWRFPAFSALLIALSASLRTLVLTMMIALRFSTRRWEVRYLMRPDESHVSLGVASRKSALQQGFFGSCCKSHGNGRAKAHDEPFMSACLNESHGHGSSKTYLFGVLVGLASVKFEISIFRSKSWCAKPSAKIGEPYRHVINR